MEQSDLTTDNYQEIFSHLDVSSRISMSLVSKRFCDLLRFDREIHRIELYELFKFNLDSGYTNLNRWLLEVGAVPEEFRLPLYDLEADAYGEEIVRDFLLPCLLWKKFEDFLFYLEFFSMEMRLESHFSVVEAMAEIDSDEARAFVDSHFLDVSFFQSISLGSIKSMSFNNIIYYRELLGNIARFDLYDEGVLNALLSCSSAFVLEFLSRYPPPNNETILSLIDNYINTFDQNMSNDMKEYIMERFDELSNDLKIQFQRLAVFSGDLSLFNMIAAKIPIADIPTEYIKLCPNNELFSLLVRNHASRDSDLTEFMVASQMTPQRVESLLAVLPEHRYSLSHFTALLTFNVNLHKSIQCDLLEYRKWDNKDELSDLFLRCASNIHPETILFLLDNQIVSLTADIKRRFLSKLSKTSPLDLLKYLRALDFEWGDALDHLISSKKVYRIRFALDHGCEFTLESLEEGVYTKSARIVRLLLDKGCPISRGAVKAVILRGNLDCRKVFEKHGVEFSQVHVDSAFIRNIDPKIVDFTKSSM